MSTPGTGIGTFHGKTGSQSWLKEITYFNDSDHHLPKELRIRRVDVSIYRNKYSGRVPDSEHKCSFTIQELDTDVLGVQYVAIRLKPCEANTSGAAEARRGVGGATPSSSV
jgi:hypothetical protein